jgi:two-component system cell cycle sensor histidine kinase PleC
LNLINDILDFSKVEAGKLVLHDSEVSIPAVVARCHRLMVEIAHRGGVALVVAVPDDCPPLRADERKLKQILLNLISNAVKFTPTGGTVTTATRVEPDGSLTLLVADTGAGMKPEDIPKALAPFVQLEDPMTRRHQGTGLGLPLTKSLVELHGGALRIESELGRGTTVLARFPAARVLPVHSEAGA